MIDLKLSSAQLNLYVPGKEGEKKRSGTHISPEQCLSANLISLTKCQQHFVGTLITYTQTNSSWPRYTVHGFISTNLEHATPAHKQRVEKLEC